MEISVILPCKNHAKYLTPCIESILRQTFKDFEIILLVAPSKDNSLEVAKSFKDKRIKVIELKEDIGINGTTNKGIELSKGKYINVFSSDDIMLPTNFEEKVRIMNENESIGLIFSEVAIIDSEGNIIRYCKYRKKNYYVNQDDYLDFITLGSFISTNSCLIRREALDSLECLYGLSDSLSAEWEMQLEILKNFKTAYISKHLVHFRRHGENLSSQFSLEDSERDFNEAIYRHIDKYSLSIREYSKIRNSFNYFMFKFCLSRGKHFKSLIYLFKLIHCPINTLKIISSKLK